MGIRLILILWTAVAWLAGYSGAFLRLPTMAPQACVAILTMILLTVYFFSRQARGKIAALTLRGLLIPHIGRFVGIYFLYLHREGRLPEAFAVRGGWGDIIAATGALLLILAAASFTKFRGAVLVWNIFGLIDIGFVVAMAVRANLTDPASMNELRHLPLSLLPTLLVPLIIGTHVIIFHQLIQNRRANAEARAKVQHGN